MPRLDCCKPTVYSGASGAYVHSRDCPRTPERSLTKAERAFYVARLREEAPPELPLACPLCGSRKTRPDMHSGTTRICANCGAHFDPNAKPATLAERAEIPDAYSDHHSDDEDDPPALAHGVIA